MLRKKDNGTPTGGGQTLNTIIGRGTVMEGTVTVENGVRIDGVFKGELKCSGTLTISQNGQAYAELEGKEVYVNGIVRGTVRAQKVRLDSQARFIGDIHTSALSMAEGAVFHGSCTMDTHDAVKEVAAYTEATSGVPTDAASGAEDNHRHQAAGTPEVATN